MNNNSLSLAAVVVATALLSATVAHAQAAQNSSASNPSAPVSQNAKPSPYQGVSSPPPDDTILTNDESAAPAPAPVNSEPAPAAASAPVRAVATAPPAREVSTDKDEAAPSETAASVLTLKDPDAEIVTFVPGPANAVPEGTVFRVRMSQNVMASETVPGTPFSAKLSQDILHHGRIVVPMGSELVGKILYTSSGRRISGGSVIHMRADEFILPDGTRYHLHAQVIDTQGSDTKATGEGNIATKMHGKRDLAELGIGGGGGALVGALAGPAGAAVGSAIGAGVMGAHLLLANQSVDLPEQSTVVFSLTAPMFLTPVHN